MPTLVFILGIIAFLVIEHPVAFWCICVPLFILTVIACTGKHTRRGRKSTRVYKSSKRGSGVMSGPGTGLNNIGKRR